MLKSLNLNYQTSDCSRDKNQDKRTSDAILYKSDGERFENREKEYTLEQEFSAKYMSWEILKETR